MAKTESPSCQMGWQAIDFNLVGVDGQLHNLSSVSGKKATIVMFICNHCPYVLCILDDLVKDMGQLIREDIGVCAILSNDSSVYAEDSFDRMILMEKKYNFPFIYLHDESQVVAHSYGAVCTPDFLVFNQSLALQYRGRYNSLNPSHIEDQKSDTMDLVAAARLIAKTGLGPMIQIPSMGCSIKWKS